MTANQTGSLGVTGKTSPTPETPPQINEGWQVGREQIARTIANAMGDNFADAFKNKQRWIAKRGMSGGRFRDINEPFQSDYLDAADAVLALFTPTPEPRA